MANIYFLNDDCSIKQEKTKREVCSSTAYAAASESFCKAVTAHDLKKCAHLLVHGIDLEARNPQTQDTPLHVVAAEAYKYPQMKIFSEMVVNFVKHGADANAQNARKEIPLQLMMSYAPQELVDATDIKNIKKVYLNENMFLNEVVQDAYSSHFDWSILERLDKKGFDFHQKNSGGLNLLDILLSEPLFAKHEPLKFLVSKGVSVGPKIQKKYATADMRLHSGDDYKDYSLVCKYFMVNVFKAQQSFVKKADESISTLYHAFFEKVAPYVTPETGKEILAEILKTTVSVNKENNKGQTPLHLALERLSVEKNNSFMQKNLKEYVLILLNMGAQPYRTDKNGNNAMHLVMKTQDADLISLFQKQYPELSQVKNNAGELPQNMPSTVYKSPVAKCNSFYGIYER